MTEILKAILANQATGYILNFGGLGILIMLSLNTMHKRFKLRERTWGLLTLAFGAIGGVLFQEVGLITLPGGSRLIVLAMAAFIGAAVAAAAAGFSAVDLRSTILKEKE